MSATWTNLDRIFDQIDDPEIGLELLAKGPRGTTPWQARNDLFWRSQFTYLRDWRAGNTLAVALALMICTFFEKPPPTWLCKAVHMLCMPAADQRACDEMRKHVWRWQAVELVRGQFPEDPRSSKKKVQGDDIWVEAAKFVANTDAKGGEEAVRKSHQLIKRALEAQPRGGVIITLQGYRREVARRDRRRKKSSGRLL